MTTYVESGMDRYESVGNHSFDHTDTCIECGVSYWEWFESGVECDE